MNAETIMDRRQREEIRVLQATLVGIFLIAFGLGMPLLSALLGLATGLLLDLSVGGGGVAPSPGALLRQLCNGYISCRDRGLAA
jgi:hypothetical protein